MKRLLGVAALFFCFFMSASDVFALTISPVRIEVGGNPGQTLRGELEMLNEQAELKKFYSSFENFEPAGDTGSPHFIGNKDGLATWLATEQFVDIAPNEKKVIPYTITIPSDAEPGGYFSAIFWGSQDPSTLEAGEVSIGGKLGVLILLRVNGDIDEKAGLSEFSAGKRFFDGLPITFSYRFANDGGDRVVPLGDIVIKNMFGGETATVSANENEGNVLPASSRKFTALWSVQDEPRALNFIEKVKQQATHFHFGIYSANLDLQYGATNQTASDNFYFVMLPWQLLIVAGVFLIVLWFLLRKYNSWIVARSRVR